MADSKRKAVIGFDMDGVLVSLHSVDSHKQLTKTATQVLTVARKFAAAHGYLLCVVSDNCQAAEICTELAIDKLVDRIVVNVWGCTKTLALYQYGYDDEHSYIFDDKEENVLQFDVGGAGGFIVTNEDPVPAWNRFVTGYFDDCGGNKSQPYIISI